MRRPTFERFDLYITCLISSLHMISVCKCVTLHTWLWTFDFCLRCNRSHVRSKRKSNSISNLLDTLFCVKADKWKGLSVSLSLFLFVSLSVVADHIVWWLWYSVGRYGRSVGRLVGRSVSQSVGRLVGRSVRQSVGRLAHPSVGQSISQKVGRVIHFPSVFRFIFIDILWKFCWKSSNNAPKHYSFEQTHTYTNRHGNNSWQKHIHYFFIATTSQLLVLRYSELFNASRDHRTWMLALHWKFFVLSETIAEWKKPMHCLTSTKLLPNSNHHIVPGLYKWRQSMSNVMGIWNSFGSVWPSLLWNRVVTALVYQDIVHGVYI